MPTPKPENAALTVLRNIFELVDADVRPKLDLLGFSAEELEAHLGQLRRDGLLQPATLGLTMKGLVLALGLSERHAGQAEPDASSAFASDFRCRVRPGVMRRTPSAPARPAAVLRATR